MSSSIAVGNFFDSALRERQSVPTLLMSSAIAQGKLAHAYLFTGRTIDDKWAVARQIACLLNCKESKGSSDLSKTCLAKLSDLEKFCQNCKWIAKGEHPQAFLTLSGDDKVSGKISVEKARAISQELMKTSEYIRVVVVPEANQDIFHRPSANALLKTIEEPQLACIFFLFANAVEDVLPTIVSRCQVIPFQVGRDDIYGKPPADPEKAALIAQASKCIGDYIDQKRVADGDWHSIIETLSQSRSMQDLAQDDLPAEELIDLCIDLSFKKWRNQAISDAVTTAYLSDFMELAERAKQQVKHYVSQKAVLESFALSWMKLRNNFNC